MASRALAAVARSPADYEKVYGRILAQVREPVILHWLGDMFDPALAGYWGSRDLDRAADTCLAIIGDHAGKIDGIKVSLLDDAREVAMRRRLPAGVRMYTGDIVAMQLDDIDRDQGTVRVSGKRSEEHTSELQSILRNSYATFCLKK